MLTVKSVGLIQKVRFFVCYNKLLCLIGGEEAEFDYESISLIATVC